MPFKRFLTWLVEKLFELNLAVAVVLLVKFFLPLSAENYTSLTAFATGVHDTYRNAMDDATYVTGMFMQGSPIKYALKTWFAAIYVVVFYGYLSSLYAFTSLLAALLGPRHHVRNCLIAYGVSAGVFWWQFVHAYDAETLRMAAAFIVLGVGVVVWAAYSGDRFYHRIGGKDPAPKHPSPSKSVGGRIRLDLGT